MFSILILWNLFNTILSSLILRNLFRNMLSDVIFENLFLNMLSSLILWKSVLASIETPTPSINSAHQKSIDIPKEESVDSVGVKIGHDGINVWKSVKISMNVFTKSNLRKEIFTKSLAVKSYLNLGQTKYRLSQDNGHVSDWPWTSSSMIIGPQTSQARSIRRDQACTRLGRYAATKQATDLEPSSVAT